MTCIPSLISQAVAQLPPSDPISVNVPLFEGGRIDASIRRERAKLAAAQEGLRELELKIRLEVQTAVLNLTSSLERVRATEKAIEQARESLRIGRLDTCCPRRLCPISRHTPCTKRDESRPVRHVVTSETAMVYGSWRGAWSQVQGI